MTAQISHISSADVAPTIAGALTS